MREFTIIRDYFAPLAHPDAALNLKDDAALLSIPEGEQLVITTDTLNEGVHFIGNESPDLIARKALRVNLSDLAAMGATPLAYTLNLSAPKDADEAFFAAIAAGLKQDQEQFTIHLLGGDTTASTAGLSLTITAYGTVAKGAALTRFGAKSGDAIYVGGTIGAGALGLAVAQGKAPMNEALLHAYQLPEPQLALSKMLRNKATACMDVSDGLVQDLTHLCAASVVGADIDCDAIPLAGKNLEACITGGDDYVLLFTAPEGVLIENATRIGTITADNEIRFLDKERNALTFTQGGYQHF